MDALTRATEARATMTAWLAETEAKLRVFDEVAARSERIAEMPVRQPKRPRKGGEPTEDAEENQKKNFRKNIHRTVNKLVHVSGGSELSVEHLMLLRRTKEGKMRRVFPAWFRAIVLFGVEADWRYVVTNESEFAQDLLDPDDIQMLRGHYSERWDGKNLMRLFEKHGRNGLQLREDVRRMVDTDLARLWSLMAWK